jgi:hypothetical protein
MNRISRRVRRLASACPFDSLTRSRRSLLLSLAVLVLAPAANSADVVNGWSAPSSITKIHSVWSYTYFKLSSTNNGCGHPELWALAVQDTPATKAKLAMLMSAYVAGKTVSLRCENSQLTDFEIVD